MRTKTISKTIVAISIIVLAFTAFFAVFFAPQAANVAFADGIEELSYRGASGLVTTTDTFSYSTKTTESYFINSSVPAYYDTLDRAYMCAPIAGANLIGFYDRYLSAFSGCTIGVVYSDYILNEVPRGRFDVSVDILLTEKGVRVTKDSRKTHPGKA